MHLRRAQSERPRASSEFGGRPTVSAVKQGRLRHLLSKGRTERNGIQRYTARRVLFAPFERIGLHVTADHFYEPVPNVRDIARTYRDAPRALPGIALQMEPFEDRMLPLIDRYAEEYRANVGRYGFKEPNAFLRGLDPLSLYLLVRDRKPTTVVEIGQGVSTRVLMTALEQCAAESGRQHRLISIDPYPRLDDLPAEVPGVQIDNVRARVQDLDMTPYLAECELLFVDSSHVHKFGSDVAVQFESIYPGLQPGSLLHLHDIFTPYDYPMDWLVKERRFWNEQYILEAFLSFNSEFEVHLPVQLLVRQSEPTRAAVKEAFGDSMPIRGSSFYLRRR